MIRPRRPATVVIAVLVCLLTTTCGPPSGSVDPALSREAEVRLERARDLYSREGPEAALPVFEEALAAYRSAKDASGEAVTLGYIGNCYKQFGEFDRARDYLERALTMKRRLGERLEEGKTLNHLGLLCWEMGHYADAIAYFDESLDVGREVSDVQLEAAVLNNLSLVLDEQGDYRRSLEQYQHALALHERTGDAQSKSATLGNIGGVYFLLGRYEEAKSYYERALEVSESHSLKPSESQDLGNLAACLLMLGRHEEAVAAYDRALSLARDAGLAKDEAEWLRGKAGVWRDLGRYDDALRAYQEALEFYETSRALRELAEALGERGALHALLGDGRSAEEDFNRALQISRDIGNPRGVALHLVALGDLEFRRGRVREAVALYRDALALRRENGEQDGIVHSLVRLATASRERGDYEEASGFVTEALDLSRELGAPLLETEALIAWAALALSRGDALESLSRYERSAVAAERSRDPNLRWRVAYGRGQALEALGRLDEAVTAYREAAIVIEGVRSQLAEERFRSAYAEDKYEVYVALVRLLVALDRPEEGFLDAERLRARRYLEQIQSLRPPIRDSGHRRREALLQQRIRHLQAQIATETERPGMEQRSQALATFQNELEAAERSYEELAEDLARSDPEYARIRSLSVPSVETVREALDAATALVEFVVGKRELTVFVVRPRGLTWSRLPVASDALRAKVELLREMLGRTESDAWQRPARSLYRDLIEPLVKEHHLEGIERLLLVPHGVLHYLPFATLARDGGTRGSARLLVQDYEIGYLPAAAALAPSRTSSMGEALVVAPSSVGLVHARAEARRVAERFSPHAHLLAGEEATEEAFKTLSSRYELLHVATHGYVNERNPLLSGLELEPGRGEDGKLEVHEILELRLDARLVTLSACETGLGGAYFTDLPMGDDFVGLTRAFLFAGSDSVLASLWRVDDASTLKLMEAFYGALVHDDAVSALAAAQRASLAGPPSGRHPFFWGAFVLVGGS